MTGLIDAAAAERETIKLGTLTAEQEWWFNQLFDHFEGWPDDHDRIRAVLKDGRKGPWFSRHWSPVGWHRFWPR
jgi:hypothetical protein